MREIIFRGKRNFNGEWLEGDLIHYTDGAVAIKQNIPDGLAAAFRIDPATVGQYTGIKDKKGRRIFEGDILCFSDGETLCTVEWRYSGFCIVEPGCYPDSILDADDGLWTIVGNIHDNPDMIERSENT